MEELTNVLTAKVAELKSHLTTLSAQASSLLADIEKREAALIQKERKVAESEARQLALAANLSIREQQLNTPESPELKKIADARLKLEAFARELSDKDKALTAKKLALKKIEDELQKKDK